MTNSTPTSPKLFDALITVSELKALLNQNAPLFVFDCSFDLAKPEAGYEQYLQTHIPGAIYADLDKHLSAKNDSQAASGGRHPLPSRERLADWLASLGLLPTTQVVVYDRNNTMIAGRLWWMLKWLGHAAVAVLDGGLPAWQTENKWGNHTNSHGSELYKASSSAVAPSHLIRTPLVQLIAAEAVAAQIGSLQTAILDARAEARFRGEVELHDPVAGHIPSALNRPFSRNMSEDGHFKSSHVLKEEFDSLLAGRNPANTIHHCGSGVSAIPNVLAMYVAGYGLTTLYAGSWSDWCQDPKRPVAQA